MIYTVSADPNEYDTDNIVQNICKSVLDEQKIESEGPPSETSNIDSKTSMERNQTLNPT